VGSRLHGRAGNRLPPSKYDEEVNLTIDLEREEGGRWIAGALEIPGVMCYGETRDGAISNVERLAIEVIADCIRPRGTALVRPRRFL
jgi:predicted RNase H-like HicB family nuclease